MVLIVAAHGQVQTRSGTRNRNNAPVDTNPGANSPAVTTRSTTTTTTTVVPAPKDETTKTVIGAASKDDTETSDPPAKDKLDEKLLTDLTKQSTVQLSDCIPYNTLIFLNTIRSMTTLATTVRERFSTNAVFQVEQPQTLLIHGILTSKQRPKTYADASRDCHDSGGRLYQPASMLDTIQLIMTRHSLVIATDAIWVNVAWSASLNTMIYPESGIEVPNLWQRDLVTYDSISANKCYVFLAGSTTTGKERFAERPCSTPHKSLCQYLVDPNKNSLESLRKSSVQELETLETQLKSHQAALRHLESRPECHSNVAGVKNIAEQLLLKQPSEELYRALAINDNERAVMTLTSPFITDLQRFSRFLSKLLNGPVFVSRDKNFICDCQITPTRVTVKIPNNFNTNLKKILTGLTKNISFTHPLSPVFPNITLYPKESDDSPDLDWLGDVSVAIMVGFTLIFGIISIILGFCRKRNPETDPPFEEEAADRAIDVLTTNDPAAVLPPEMAGNSGFRLFRIMRQKLGRRKDKPDTKPEVSKEKAEGVELQPLNTPPSAPPAASTPDWIHTSRSSRPRNTQLRFSDDFQTTAPEVHVAAADNLVPRPALRRASVHSSAETMTGSGTALRNAPLSTTIDLTTRQNTILNQGGLTAQQQLPSRNIINSPKRTPFRSSAHSDPETSNLRARPKVTFGKEVAAPASNEAPRIYIISAEDIVKRRARRHRVSDLETSSFSTGSESSEEDGPGFTAGTVRRFHSSWA